MIELIALIVAVIEFSCLVGIYIEINKTNDLLHYMYTTMDKELKKRSTPPSIPS